MAKLTILTQASPAPFFARELAAWPVRDKEKTGDTQQVAITTAAFGYGGGLGAMRSYWLIDDRTQTAKLGFVEEWTTGEGDRGFQGTEEQPPKTHKAILAGWLRERWNMEKLRGRIK